MIKRIWNIASILNIFFLEQALNGEAELDSKLETKIRYVIRDCVNNK
jgi:hypothetical protein